jgi:hypothetical protein
MTDHDENPVTEPVSSDPLVTPQAGSRTPAWPET